MTTTTEITPAYMRAVLNMAREWRATAALALALRRDVQAAIPHHSTWGRSLRSVAREAQVCPSALSQYLLGGITTLAPERVVRVLEVLAGAPPCTCGNLPTCTCQLAATHAETCRFLRASRLPVEVACPHGFQACPECDPCDCGVGATAGVR